MLFTDVMLSLRSQNIYSVFGLWIGFIRNELTPHACRMGSSVTFPMDQVAPADWLGEANKQAWVTTDGMSL